MLTHSDCPLAQVSPTVDDERSAVKDLGTELDNAYRMSNNQMVINIQQELQTNIFDRDEEWDKHVKNFYHLDAKLAFYDNP